MILISAQAFPPRSGGIENLMESLAFFSAHHPSAQDIIVFADGGSKECAYDQSHNTPYKIHRFGGLKPIRRRAKAQAINQFIRANPVNAIICDSWKSAEHLPAHLPVPITIYAHGNEYPRHGAQAKQNQKAPSSHKIKRIQKALGRASALIAVSRDTQTRLGPYLPSGLTPGIIHPPVRPPVPADQIDHDFAATQWPHDGIRCLALSRLIDWKGIDRAIEAIAAMRAAGHKAQLVIAGDGTDRSRLKARVRDLNIHRSVHFSGRVEGARKTALFESADIFLQPGRQVGDQCEGFGITYLEAALHGLPTISGNKGGAPEAIRDRVSGFVVNGDDQSAVNQALKTLIDNPDLRAQFSKAGRAHADAALWPRQVNKILALAQQSETAS